MFDVRTEQLDLCAIVVVMFDIKKKKQNFNQCSYGFNRINDVKNSDAIIAARLS